MEAVVKNLLRRALLPYRLRASSDSTLIAAAVLVLVYPKEGEYCILLNKRTHLVEHHKDEMSFPGGRKDGSDITLLDAALRETHEEMGVRPEDVDVLGRLDDTSTSTGFLITPFVGTMPDPYEFFPSDEEVAAVVEIPISALMDATSLRDEIRIVDSMLVNAPTYAHEGHLIHGATGRLLKQLLCRVSSVSGKEVLWTRK